MDFREMRELAKRMIVQGVRSADPEQLVKKNLEIDGSKIKICRNTFNHEDYQDIVVLGIGKASVPMAIGCEKLNPDDGLVITKFNDNIEEEKSPVKVKKAHHPYPKEANIEATNELLSKV
ncbi:MAG: DUF4147 domain-containing protein, partial [Candidatus Thermoplasmatota archaeon]